MTNIKKHPGAISSIKVNFNLILILNLHLSSCSLCSRFFLFLFKDIYRNTDAFVMYQMWLNVDFTVNAQQLNADAATRLAARYYYIEKSNDSREFVLIHSSRYHNSKPEANNLLFTSLPHGLLVRGDMHLFDSTLGCVYIVKNWSRQNLYEVHKLERNIVKMRINVPYEKYFRCSSNFILAPDFYSIRSPDRCDVTNILSSKDEEYFLEVR